MHAGLQTIAMISAFGNFLRLYIEKDRRVLPSTSHDPPRRNAFELRMCAEAEKVPVLLKKVLARK